METGKDDGNAEVSKTKNQTVYKNTRQRMRLLNLWSFEKSFFRVFFIKQSAEESMKDSQKGQTRLKYSEREVFTTRR